MSFIISRYRNIINDYKEIVEKRFSRLDDDGFYCNILMKKPYPELNICLKYLVGFPVANNLKVVEGNDKVFIGYNLNRTLFYLHSDLPLSSVISKSVKYVSKSLSNDLRSELENGFGVYQLSRCTSSKVESSPLYQRFVDEVEYITKNSVVNLYLSEKWSSVPDRKLLPVITIDPYLDSINTSVRARTERQKKNTYRIGEDFNAWELSIPIMSMLFEITCDGKVIGSYCG